MNEIAKKELYHIRKLGIYSEKWQIGNSFRIGEEHNPMHNRIYETHIKPNENIAGSLYDMENQLVNWIHKYRKNEPNINEKIDFQRCYQQHSMLNKYAFNLLQVTREIVLEKVRETNFPNKPSRLKGMFFTELQHLKRWQRIISDNKDDGYKIYRVEFTGNLHKGDESWITNNSLSINSYYKNAMGYWQGNLKSKKGKALEEYLGTGTITILQENDL